MTFKFKGSNQYDDNTYDWLKCAEMSMADIHYRYESDSE